MKNAYVSAIDAYENRVSSMAKTVRVPVTNVGATSGVPFGSAYVPTNTTLDLFSNVRRTIANIDNETVKKQTIAVLNQFVETLDRNNVHIPPSCKLSAHITEDGSCLIEWHFTRVHIGLSLEPLETDSFYFLTAIDEAIDEIETKTRKIKSELDKVVDKIVNFVADNMSVTPP